LMVIQQGLARQAFPTFSRLFLDALMPVLVLLDHAQLVLIGVRVRAIILSNPSMLLYRRHTLVAPALLISNLPKSVLSVLDCVRLVVASAQIVLDRVRSHATNVFR